MSLISRQKLALFLNISDSHIWLLRCSPGQGTDTVTVGAEYSRSLLLFGATNAQGMFVTAA